MEKSMFYETIFPNLHIKGKLCLAEFDYRIDYFSFNFTNYRKDKKILRLTDFGLGFV